MKTNWRTATMIAAAFVLTSCDPENSAPNPVPGSGAESDTETARIAARAGAEATLDTFYAAAADADFDRWIAVFTKGARLYGTDVTEDWPREVFAETVEQSFSAGNGWDFSVRDRHVTLSPDATTAWFADVAHFANTDYTLRPTGALVKTDDGWKIAQLVMGIPFPNDIHASVRMALQATEAGAAVERERATGVLDQLHARASGGDADAYFDLYTEDAVFLGTDLGERWDMVAFRGYADPAFEDGEGWTYTVRDRQITLSPMKNVAWFDEVLDNEKYGTSRGTGVLLRTDDGWKIVQYHLTFPIPNDLAEDMTRRIKRYEAQNAGQDD